MAQAAQRTNLDSSGEKYPHSHMLGQPQISEIASSFSSEIVLKFIGCPFQRSRKKNSKPRKGAVEAQQIHRGSSSQLPAQEVVSLLISLPPHRRNKEKNKETAKSSPCDNVLTAVVKIKGNLQTLPASKIHTFIPKVSSHPISRALLLFKSALQRTSLRNLRGFGGHQKYPAHPL